MSLSGGSAKGGSDSKIATSTSPATTTTTNFIGE